MLDFYRAVSECKPGKKNMTAVAIDGPAFGQKAVYEDGELVWESEEGGFFTANKKELLESLGRGQEGCKNLVKLQGSSVFFDWLGQEMELVICGGGHVSMPVIKIGLMLGCHVTVLEDRPMFADNARRAGAAQVLCETFEHGLDKIEGGDNTYFVIVTRGHRHDQVCLEKIVRKKHAYIGMIGSSRRVAAVKELVIEGGGSPEVLEQVYSPIGLDIGAETPEEIGVAIMGEIIKVKNKKRRTCGYSKDMLREILNPGTAGERQERRVLATIVTRKGSAPRDVGTKMLILPDGRCIGTIGGGCMESDVIRRALHMIRTGGQETTGCVPAGGNPMDRQAADMEERKLCHVDMTGADAEDEGMVCGGVVDVLLEVV